jgi:hypothetical protein
LATDVPENVLNHRIEGEYPVPSTLAEVDAAPVSQVFATVIETHCYLDNALEALLRRAFVRGSGGVFEPGRGTLWQFTSKVHIACAVGRLVTPRMRDDLLLVNRIRNAMAHRIRQKTFRTPQLRRWVSELHFVKKIRASAEGSSSPKAPAVLKAIAKGRVAFTTATMFLGVDLENMKVKRLPVATHGDRGNGYYERPPPAVRRRSRERRSDGRPTRPLREGGDAIAGPVAMPVLRPARSVAPHNPPGPGLLASTRIPIRPENAVATSDRPRDESPR